MKIRSKFSIYLVLLTCMFLFISPLVGVESEHIHDNHDEHKVFEQESDHLEDKEHGHDDEHIIIHLTETQKQSVNIDIAKVRKGQVDNITTFLGEVSINEDRMVHIVPRVSGIVTLVCNKLGDTVQEGQVLAIIESMELADAQSQYLANYEKKVLAEIIYKREESLWKDKITSENEYLNARQAYLEARINFRTSKQKLFAIGFTEESLGRLLEKTDGNLTRFEIKAPFKGQVIEKHIVLGEMIKSDANIFTIADLSTVWVDLQVFAKDIGSVSVFDKVHVDFNNIGAFTEGVIDYVSPILNADTRTALARVILENPNTKFNPGSFVTAKMYQHLSDDSLIVPINAVQIYKGKKCVFIPEEDFYEVVFVTTGKFDRDNIEIISGLKLNQDYVSNGAFDLKSILVTSTLDSHAGHGH